MDAKEEPLSKGSQKGEQIMQSDGSESEASESENDSGSEDDEPKTKYFHGEESDDAFKENESSADLDS